MADYKITQISQNAPREWKGDHGTTYYIRVKLEGHDRPVEIGKKKPDALKVGDTVSGTITATPDYPADKFKADYNNSPRGNYQPKDEAAIKAMWAIGQAVQLTIANGKLDIEAIEVDADKLFAMVDRVKSGAISETMVDKGDFAQTEFDDLPPIDQLSEPF